MAFDPERVEEVEDVLRIECGRAESGGRASELLTPPPQLQNCFNNAAAVLKKREKKNVAFIWMPL